jgi:hypothetical protein
MPPTHSQKHNKIPPPPHTHKKKKKKKKKNKGMPLKESNLTSSNKTSSHDATSIHSKKMIHIYISYYIAQATT